ncbi:uncharacterized protein LOC117111449 [Anneissia japonica]|uniref:uncharacterized protein LOC117111449 n=1 Tax=Anneissia japonica TaxID=1529436 RepID=UPI00142557D7|nr:uncharacterized protein LOC117111449 [Anneissia japonica]
MDWKTKPETLFILFCIMLTVECMIKATDETVMVTLPKWNTDKPQTYRKFMPTTNTNSLRPQLPTPESVPGEIGKMQDTSSVSIHKKNKTPVALNKSNENSKELLNSTISTEQKLNSILVLKKIACTKTSKHLPDSDACYYLIKPKENNWKFQCTDEENLENCSSDILVDSTEAQSSLKQSNLTCKPVNGTNNINKCWNSLSTTDNCSSLVDYFRIVMVDARTRQQTDSDECDMWFIKSLLAESMAFGFLGVLFVNNFIWVWCWTKRKRQEKLTIQPKSYKQEDFEIIYAWQNSHENASLRPTPKAKRPRRIREVPLYENLSIHEIVSTV